MHSFAVDLILVVRRARAALSSYLKEDDMFLATIRLLAVLVVLTSWLSAGVQTSVDALPSWNDGTAKQAVLDFVRKTTDAASTNYVLPEDRIATFDQDGTLWVEHPMYTQVVYAVERVPALVATKPELKNIEPFKTVLSGNTAKFVGCRDNHPV
jgi:hypothetical protein